MKGSVIEVYLMDFWDVSIMQDLFQKFVYVNFCLWVFGIFDSCVIILDVGFEEFFGMVMVFFCFFFFNIVILDWIVKLDIFVFQCQFILDVLVFIWN